MSFLRQYPNPGLMRAKLFIALFGIVAAVCVWSQRTIHQSVIVQRTYNLAGMREFDSEILEVRPYGPELLGQIYQRSSGNRLSDEGLRQLATDLACKRGKDQDWAGRFMAAYNRMRESKR